jgi:LacI family transcriptional regulator
MTLGEPADVRRGTIKEVAKAAGVHPSTVSRSLDPLQASRVRDETRRRVLAAAEALNYRRDVIASGLRRQRSYTVGVLVPDLGNPIHASLVRGISRRLERDHYSAILLETEDQHERFRAGIELFKDRRVDGVISAATRAGDAKVLRALVRSGVSVVMAVRWVREVGVPVVANDDYRGGVMATEHLVQLGHRRPAQLHGPTDIETFNERGQGFNSTLARAGLLPVTPPRDVARTPSVDEGRRLMRLLLEQGHRPTGVFAHNDLMAVGAIEVLQERGLRCPEDVSVIGYNDMPLTEHLAPPLSTIRMPTADVGRVAAERLLELVHGRESSAEPSTVSISLQPVLVVRGSTGAPPGNQPDT